MKAFISVTAQTPAPGVNRAITRLGKFLTLVGLTALLIGGVGVANAVTTFVQNKRATIATLKCLGAKNTLIFNIYLTQVLIISTFGVAIGLVIGFLAPLILEGLLSNILPVELSITPHTATLTTATLYGFLVALLFALWPLRRIRDVRPQMLFRDFVSKETSKPNVSDILIIAIIGVILTALIIYSSNIPLIATYFCAGLIALFIIFALYGRLIAKAVKKLPRIHVPELVLARANLASPASLTQSIILSLGLGLSLLVTVALIDFSMVSQLKSGLPDNAPSYFFLDIKKDQYPTFQKIVKTTAPDAKLSHAPMLRGRITQLAGTPTEPNQSPPECKMGPARRQGPDLRRNPTQRLRHHTRNLVAEKL